MKVPEAELDLLCLVLNAKWEKLLIWKPLSNTSFNPLFPLFVLWPLCSAPRVMESKALGSWSTSNLRGKSSACWCFLGLQMEPQRRMCSAWNLNDQTWRWDTFSRPHSYLPGNSQSQITRQVTVLSSSGCVDKIDLFLIWTELGQSCSLPLVFALSQRTHILVRAWHLLVNTAAAQNLFEIRAILTQQANKTISN